MKLADEPKDVTQPSREAAPLMAKSVVGSSASATRRLSRDWKLITTLDPPVAGLLPLAALEELRHAELWEVARAPEAEVALSCTGAR